MKKSLFTTIVLLTLCIIGFAQVGSIEGTIFYKESKETVPGATVQIISGKTQTTESSSIDGRFKLKPLDPGLYSIKIQSLGSHDVIINDIVVRPNQISFVPNINLISDAIILDIGATIIGTSERIIDPEETSKLPINRGTIARLPGSKKPVDIAVKLSTEISKGENNQMIIRGSRPGSSSIYLDGIKMSSESSGIPGLAVGDMEVYTGGVPAKYGDFTGGVVIMRTASYFDLLSAYESQSRRIEELAEMEEDLKNKNKSE